MDCSPNIVFTAVEGPVRDQLWSQSASAAARKLGFEVRLNPCAKPLSQEQWAELFEGAEAIITTWGAPRLDDNTLARNTTLKFVGHAAGSVAPFVSKDLFDRGVRVSTANDELAKRVAQWCLMMTMIALRGLIHYAQLGPGRPMTARPDEYPRDPGQCVIGIWGYGAITRKYISLLRGLGPKEILVADNYLTGAAAAQAGVTKVPFDEIFQRGDVVVLLQSLTEKTSGRVGAEQLSAIRDGAVFINTARAHLVQYDALVCELSTGRITGIFDVHHKEPMPDDDPLRKMPNVIMTPHCAGKGTRGGYVKLMLEEFARLRRGEELLHEITHDRALTMTSGAQS